MKYKLKDWQFPKKLQVIHKSCLLLCFFILSVSINIALATALTDADITNELLNETSITPSSSAIYLFEKQLFIDEIAPVASQTVATFHNRLLLNKKAVLPSEQKQNWIPITGDITFFIPQEETIYPLATQVGDRFVEGRLIRRQIREILGRHLLTYSYSSEATQINDLYNNAYELASKSTFNKKFGQQLTQSDVDNFNLNVIWPELRTINGTQVLVPTVHLTSTTKNEQAVVGHTVEFVEGQAQFEHIIIDSGNLTLRKNALLSVTNSLTVDEDAYLTAYGDLNLSVGGTLLNYGQISASESIELFAKNYTQKTKVHRFKTTYGMGDTLGKVASISAEGDLTILAPEHIQFYGAEVSAGGNIVMQANGNIIIGTQTLSWENSIGQGNNITELSSRDHVQSVLSAGENIQLMAGGLIEINASTLHADTGIIEMLANSGIYISNEFNQFQSSRNAQYANTTIQESQFQTIAIRSSLEAGKGVLIATEFGDITLKATQINSGDGTEINAANGRVNLLLAKEQDHYFYNSVDEGFWKIKTETITDQDDTAVYNSIVGGVKVQATHGVTIEIGQQEGATLQDSLNAFSNTEDLAWMSDLHNDPLYADNIEIVFQELLNIHEHDKTSNLSPAAMSIIAIAVAVAMGPAGFELVGAGGSIGSVGYSTTMQAAMQAGATTLATQAATGLANGQGLDGTLKAMMSEESIRALATSMVTAGALSSLGELNFVKSPNAVLTTQGAVDIANQSIQVLVESTVKAGISTVIQGGDLGDFEDSFFQSLAVTSINHLGSALSSDIETYSSTAPNIAFEYIAHAAVGCLTGSLSANEQDSDSSEGCVAGAGGAVVANYVANSYNHEVDQLSESGEAVAKFLVDNIEFDRTKLSPEQIDDFRNTGGLSPNYLVYIDRFNGIQLEVSKLQAAGADISKLSAGLIAFISGATANQINIAGDNGSTTAQASLDRTFDPVIAQAIELVAVLDEIGAIQQARLTIATPEVIHEFENMLPIGFQGIIPPGKLLTGNDIEFLYSISIIQQISDGNDADNQELKLTLGEGIYNEIKTTYGGFSFDWNEFFTQALASDNKGELLTEWERILNPETGDYVGNENLDPESDDYFSLDDVQLNGLIVTHTFMAETLAKYNDYEPLFDSIDNLTLGNLVNKIGIKSVKASEEFVSLSYDFIKNLFKKKFVKKLDTKVAKKASDVISNEEGNDYVAVSASGVADRGLQSPVFGNINLARGIKNDVLQPFINRFTVNANLDSFKIHDVDGYIELVRKQYDNLDDNPLTESMVRRIKAHIIRANDKANGFHVSEGLPGLHAEVQSANYILAKTNGEVPVKDIQVITYKTAEYGDGIGDWFKACTNCKGILYGFDVITGVVP